MEKHAFVRVWGRRPPPHFLGSAIGLDCILLETVYGFSFNQFDVVSLKICSIGVVYIYIA